MARTFVLRMKMQLFFSLLTFLKMNETYMLHGRFQNNSLVKGLDNALTHSSLKGNSKNSIQNSSLNDIISLVEGIRKDVKGHWKEDHYVFTDIGNQEAEIIREAVRHNKIPLLSGDGASGTIHYNSFMNGAEKSSIYQHMIDEMMLFLNSSFIAEKGIVVFTDNSDYGEFALTRILQRCSETKRMVSGFKMISEKSSTEEISKYLQGDLFVLDCDGKIAAKLLKVAKQMGYTGYHGSVTWILSQRTMDSLLLSCSLPEGKYFGIQAEFGVIDAEYPLRVVHNCFNTSSDPTKLECSRARHNIESVIVNQLARLEEPTGRAWVEVTSSTEAKYFHEFHGNPFWPRLRVAVADTFEPWITVVDFNKTTVDSYVCGLNGKYGFRYANSTSNITIPICAYGLAIDIVRYLEEKHEVVCDIHVSRDGLYGGYDASSGKVTGLPAEILNGEADIAVDMIEDRSRRKVIEFTKAYEVSHHGIAYIHRHQEIKAGVLSPFDGVLWLVIISVIIGFVFFVWMLERLSPYGAIQKFKRSLKDNEPTFCITDSMEYIWGTLCSGEIINKKPVATGSRIAAIFLAFGFTAIVAVYSGNLITSFVVNDERPLIRGLKDILTFGDTVGTQSETATSNYLESHSDVKVRQLFEKMQHFSTYKESINALKNGKIRFFLSDYLSLKHTASSYHDCAMKVIQADSNYAALGLSFKKGSPLKRKLNIAAVAMTDSGEKDRLFQYWFGSGKCIMCNEFHPLEIRHLDDVFIWASYGACLCFFIVLVLFLWRGGRILYRSIKRSIFALAA